MTSARTLVSAATSSGSTTMPALPRRDARRRKIRFLHPPADCLTPPPGNSRNRHVANNSPLVVPPPIPATAIATLLVILRILGISTSIPRIPPTRRMADDVVTKKEGPPFGRPPVFLPAPRAESDLSHSTVHVDLYTSNVGSILRSEKCHCAGHLFRLSKPLHRNFRDDFLREFIDGFF